MQKVLEDNLRYLIKTKKSEKKNILIFSLIFSIISIIFTLLVHIACLLLLLPILLILLIIFLDEVAYLKKYEAQILLKDNVLCLYDYKDKLLRSFNLIECNKCFLSIRFSYSITKKETNSVITYKDYKKCLVFYKKTNNKIENFSEQYDFSDYNKLYNNKNLLIIENPDLIEQLSH